MGTITFDTHKFIRTLKEAGVPEIQAEAFSEAFKEAQGEADLATKRDIDGVRRDMRELEQRLIIKLGALVAIYHRVWLSIDSDSGRLCVS